MAQGISEKLAKKKKEKERKKKRKKEKHTHLWGEIPQHQPAAGSVGAVCTPCGSLCNTDADRVKN